MEPARLRQQRHRSLLRRRPLTSRSVTFRDCSSGAIRGNANSALVIGEHPYLGAALTSSRSDGLIDERRGDTQSPGSFNVIERVQVNAWLSWSAPIRRSALVRRRALNLTLRFGPSDIPASENGISRLASRSLVVVAVRLMFDLGVRHAPFRRATRVAAPTAARSLISFAGRACLPLNKERGGRWSS